MRFVGIVLCCLFLVMVSPSVHASNEATWEQSTPQVIRSRISQFEMHPFCPTFTLEITVENALPIEPSCLFSGEDFDIATGDLNTFGWRAMISFRNEREFHVLDGVCGGIAGCQYVPAADVMIERYLVGMDRVGLKAYRKVSDRIQRVFDPVSGSFRYVFDNSYPEILLTGEDEQPLPVGAINVSDNGEWLAFEIPNMGIGKLNLINGQKRRVDISGITYGMGADPRMELAISNDGRYLAVMGEGAGMRVITSSVGCGSSLEPLGIDEVVQSTYPCPTTIISPELINRLFYAAFHPKFSTDGGALVFNVLFYGEPSRKVTISSTATTPFPSVGYIALGDSFSSGEGEWDDKYYLPQTNEMFEKCHTSKRSYPFLLSSIFGVSTVKNIACAGATMGDLIGNDMEYEGQSRRLGKSGRNLSEYDRSVIQAQALEAFNPGRVRQAAFLREYLPDVVTVGIGGNDAGFTTKLRACVMPGTCEWAASSEMIHRTGIEITSLYQKLTQTLRSLREASSDSRIIVVGYPSIVSSALCHGLVGALLDTTERRFIEEGTDLLNKVLEAAAHSVGLEFVDTTNALIGKRLCDDADKQSVNGLRTGDDLSVISSLPMLKLIGNESFHPNPYGHELIAAEISRSLQQHLQTNCGNECGDIKNQNIDEYWGAPSHNSVEQHAGRIVSNEMVDPINPVLLIDIDDFTFAPHSTVRFELHSDTQGLGELKANARGGLQGELYISKDTVEGFHTLHAYGMSFSEISNDLYQGITFGEVDISMKPLSGGDNVDLITTNSLGGLSQLSQFLQESKREALGISRSIALYLSSPKQILWIGLIVPFILIGIGFSVFVLLFRRKVKKYIQDRGG